MLKWLKDRQLGHKTNRKTIYENINRPELPYTGRINHTNDRSEWCYSTYYLKWTSDGQFLVSLGETFLNDEDFDFLENITIWENPNTFSQRRIKSKIDLKKIGVYNIHDECCRTMQCHNSHVVVGGYARDYSYGDGAIHFISLSTGKLERTIGVVEMTTYLEFISDNVMVGLSGSELQRKTKRILKNFRSSKNLRNQE